MKEQDRIREKKRQNYRKRYKMRRGETTVEKTRGKERR